MTDQKSPAAPVDPVTRTLHGETVSDPYAWMRDHDDPRLLTYLTAERAYYDRHTERLEPLVRRLVTEIGERTITAAHEFTWRVGGHEYFVRAPHGTRTPRYLRRPVGDPGGEVEVVLDLAVLGEGRDFTRIGVFEPSPDGRWLAYSVDHVGYESYELRFRDLSTGDDLPRTRAETYYTGAWSTDSATFHYVVHNLAMRPYQVFAHDLTAPPDAPDRLVWTEEDERFNTTVRTTRSREWIVVSNQSRTTSEELLLPAGRPGTDPLVVRPRRPNQVYLTEHQRTGELDQLVVLVSENGEERRLVAAPTAELPARHWRELARPEPGVAWQRVDSFAGGLLLSGHRDGTTVFQLYTVDGEVHEFTPGTPAGCLIVEGRRDPTRVELDNRTAYDSPAVVLTEHSLVDPPRHHRIDLRTGDRTPLAEDRVANYDRSRYRTERIVATSPDGLDIPVTIAHRADLRPDGTNPCLLFCYGAYERPWEPVFTSAVISLLDRGFVYAIAHVRGGGELGRRGWIGGSMTAKPNSYRDLLTARARLVDLGWADGGKVVCHGSCAGGIVVGQAYTQDPHHWAAVLAETPAVDILNVMLDEKAPLTVNEWEEWGDPRDEEIYQVMRGYVAYENVTDRRRPPVLMTAYHNDPRVMVDRPARWTAALRRVDTHDNEILLRTELGDGGHHGPTGSGHAQRVLAELYAFVVDRATGGRW